MASDLKSFLVKTNKLRNTKTIPVTLKSGDKREIDIQSLRPQELKNIYSKNTKTYPPAEGTSMSSTSLDNFDFAVDVLITGITAPDLQSVELQDFFGVYTQQDLVYEMFDLDEIGRISGEIINLGGKESKITTTGTEPTAVREAKNS